MHRNSNTDNDPIADIDANRLCLPALEESGCKTQSIFDTFTVLPTTVAYRLSGSPQGRSDYSRQFPVTEMGENHVSFLTEFPIRIRSRITLLCYYGSKFKETLSIDGTVIYCLPGKYHSVYRFQVCVLFDPLCMKRLGFFMDAVDEKQTAGVMEYPGLAA